MPARDGTGPLGTGPVGRGMGGCMQSSNIFPAGRGFFGRGGMGRGLRRGFGRGFCERFGGPQPAYTREEEAALLEDEIQSLSQQIKIIEERLANLREQKA